MENPSHNASCDAEWINVWVNFKLKISTLRQESDN